MSDTVMMRTPTPSQTVGPFFHVALTTPALGCLVSPADPRARIRFAVRVIDGDAAPVGDALVEIWQVDADGRGARSRAADAFTAFGRLATDDDGCCEFETIRPGGVPDGRGGRHASHVNVCVFARGLLRPVFTRAYFEDDPTLGTDAVLALVDEGRRTTLLARRDERQPDRWLFPVRLQGEQETVFFDL